MHARSYSFVLLMMVLVHAASSQTLIRETFEYPNVGGLVDCSLLSATSPYYPVLIDSIGHPNWLNGATSAFDAPVLVDSVSLAYPGYSLSGMGKRIYLPAISTSPRQSARRAYPGQSAKVYYGMMVRIQEQFRLGTMVNGVVADKASQDLNGTTIACINTSTSSSGIRGLLVFNRADTVGGAHFGKVIAGVSYKRDDVATAFSSKRLDTMTTHLMVVCTDPATATTKLWIDPIFSAVEPSPDAVCTNADGAESILPIYFTLYQRSGYPSAWIGGLRVGSNWASIAGPELTLNKRTMAFDTLLTGARKTDTVVITNSGSAPLVISSISPSSQEISVSPASGTVAPGASLHVVIGVRLSTAVSFSGSVTISHNGSAIADTVSITAAGISVPSVPLLLESFAYPVGGLDAGNPLSPRMNVSKGLWVCGTTSSFTDSIRVDTTVLLHDGYSLSGIGRSIFLPNDVAATSNDRAYRSFPPQTGPVYYSLLLSLKDVANLSSHTSTNGEYFIGLWPSTAATNALYRGLVTVRLGAAAGTYQLGIRATQPTANSATAWAAPDLTPGVTYLVIVRYDRGSLPSASLWIDPAAAGKEPAPDAVSAVSVAMTDNADIGRFGIYQRGLTPHVRLGGLRVSATWNTFGEPIDSLSKQTIDFGSNAPGIATTDSVTVTNSGSAPWYITAVSTTDSAFTVLSAPASVAAGASGTIVLRCRFDSAQSHSGTIVIVSNALHGTDTLSLSYLRKNVPAALFSGRSIVFGTMAVGTTKKDSLTITNTGNAALQISSVTSTSGVFSVVPLTVSIPPAGTQTFIITATLDSAQHRSAKLVFTHNGTPASDTVTVSLQSLTDVTAEDGVVPDQFRLHQNFPNPFNPSTTVRYSIVTAGMTDLEVFDLLGRRVAVLVHAFTAPGTFSVRWNAEGLSSGWYVCRLHSGTDLRTIKMFLLK